MLRSKRLWLVFLACFWAFAAKDAAEAAGSCESIQDAFAYNQCLARSTPPRAQQGRRRGARAPEAQNRGEANGDWRSAEQSERGVHITRRRGERVKAVIDPWAGARGPARRRR